MGNNNTTKILLSLCFFVFTLQVFAQNNQLISVKESNGISVYKQKDAHENINRIVARTQVDAYYMEVLCLIKDFEHQQDWIYANHGAFCIDSISPFEWVYYGISEIPWPVQDRDVVAKVQLEIDEENQMITIHSIAKPDLIPASDEMVRIQMLDSKWRLKKLDKGTLVEMDLLVDVGGNVPSWLVNLFSANGPYNTFKNMQQELKKPELLKDCGYKDFFEK